MGLQEIMLLVLLAFSYLLDNNGGASGRILSREEDLELDRQLKILNKPAIKTIQNEDGSIVDCVDINKQPAFDHPLLKNHTIQMTPSLLPENMILGSLSPRESKNIGLQGVICPQGTVPIRRTQKKDLIAAKSLSNIYADQFHPHAGNSDINRFAILGTVYDDSIKYFGSHGYINIRQPQVVLPNQFSNGAMWINNRENPDQINSIQAGWAVNPSLFGDDRTYLYAYWTPDSFRTTGCFNMLCPGFVQVSKENYLGEYIGKKLREDPDSIYVLQALMFKDPNTGDWWFCLYTDTKYECIGYWPISIFTSLASYATELQWGGHVFSPANTVPPPMGSGYFDAKDSDNTCYIRSLQYVDGANWLRDPNDIPLGTSGINACYSAEYEGYLGDSYIMYFGGPGGQNCG